jgi:hypothetical protein
VKASSLRLSIILSLAAVSIVGRLALVWIPNVSLSYLALAVAGLAYGVRAGAAVGFLGRLGSDLLISGLNPILFPMTLVETLFGAGFGLLGFFIDVPRFLGGTNWWTRLILFDVGVTVTLAYSVASDSVTWLFYNVILTDAPDAARGTLWTTLVFLGLAFSVVPAIVHGILFAAALPPIFRGLDASSLLRERARSTTPESVDSTGLPRGP